jgi:Cu(I)/Ag(I) efflux system membrane protein CusA/SilA
VLLEDGLVRVFGKAGRAETSTDPAPLSMVETTVLLKPRSEWRAGMTRETLEAELHEKLQFPGVTNSFVMPIRNRIDMLATGIRTPVGVKVFGPDLAVIERLGASIELAVRDIRGTRSVFAERTAGGYFLDIDLDRNALARYGISVRQAESVIATAIGGEPLTTTIEGRERYGAVRIRASSATIPPCSAACSSRRRRAPRSRSHSSRPSRVPRARR